MFDFVFTGLPAFLVGFIPGLINILLVVYIMILLPRNRLINIFTVFTLCAASWQIADAFCRISATAEVADKWDSILGFGWAFTGPTCLHFALLYTRVTGTNVPRALTALIYLPCVVFLSLYQAHVYEHPFQWLEFWGWVNYRDTAPADIISVYWLSFLGFLASILLFYHAWKVRNDALLRRQAYLIAVGVSIPTIVGIITQAIFPLIGRPAIPVTSSFITLFTIAAVIALKRYRLFSISELMNYDMLLDELPVAVFNVSDTGHLLYINQAGADLLNAGEKPEGNIKIGALLQHTSPEHSTVFSEVYAKALKGISTTNAASTVIAGEETLSILISATPIVNNKKIRSVLVYMRDITAQTVSEQALQQKNLQLEQSNANLEEFAYVASHDLKEPLRKIVTFSGMIAETEKDRLSEKSRMFFERIQGAAARMQLMIEDLLSLSIISQNNKFERFSLQTIVDEVVLDLDLKIKEKNATIYADNLPVAYISPQQFRQLFLNLVNNSLKFSKPQVPLVITIKSHLLTLKEASLYPLPKNNRYLQITVEDNGIGFENVYAEKMFQMFQRLHGKIDYEGTGIGLAICRKIVENHKGIIVASGEPGKGAVFTIVIPHK
jgi:signal transduction histidine kinase